MLALHLGEHVHSSIFDIFPLGYRVRDDTQQQKLVLVVGPQKWGWGGVERKQL